MQRTTTTHYLVFSIPARGLIGLRTRLLNATQGTAVMHHRFDRYKPRKAISPGPRRAGLDGRRPGGGLRPGQLQERAELFVSPGDEVYEGMIVGENSRTETCRSTPPRRRSLPTCGPP